MGDVAVILNYLRFRFCANMVHLGADQNFSTSPRSLKKSFASLLNSSSCTDNILQGKRATNFRGEPAVLLDDDEIQKLCSPLKFALVGSFTHTKPSFKRIKEFFVARGLKGQVEFGLLNQRQILIRPSLEEDYIRIWERKIWNIDSSNMRVVKWSPYSHLMKESPIASVWIAFPYLPAYCFEKSMLFALTSAYGNPLKLDEATANLSRPSVARVLVEVDVSKKYKDRIWIGTEKVGFFQRAVFENMPKYCNYCYKMGHEMNECYVKAPSLKESQNVLPKDNISLKKIIHEEEKTKKVHQKYVPKIGVVENDKGKAAQVDSTPKENGGNEVGPSNCLEFSGTEKVLEHVDDSKGDDISPKGLQVEENQNGDNMTLAASPSPSLHQVERGNALTFHSALPSPFKRASERHFASHRFAHTDEESGQDEEEEEQDEDEEEDEDFMEDPDYSPHMPNYDFYSYSSSKKGFKTGRLLGRSKR